MADNLLPLVPGDDTVPRVQDVVIGERLGMARPTNIRRVIETNMDELQAFGPVHAARAVVARPQGGSIEVTEYHLNEEQALLVCALSRTAKAAEVRRDLIMTYTAYRRGQLGAPIDPRQIGGIMKAVVRAQIKEALTELAPQIIAQQMAVDPRVAAVDAVPALQVAIDAKVPASGRRPIVRAISNSLARHCEARGHVIRRDARGTKLYPLVAAHEWRLSGGDALIRKLVAASTPIGPLFAIAGGKV